MITFNKLQFKNFLSYSNQVTTIVFNSGLNLISGKNGSGKSVILDAIVYCLYGKGLRNVKNAELINRHNKKNMQVSLELTINGIDYKIVRGLKPEIFEIYKNNEIFPSYNKNDMQLFLENLLKFDIKIFKQIVILGSDLHIPFMKLSLPDRRVIIERLFELEQLVELKKKAKEIYTKKDKERYEYKLDLQSLNNKMEFYLKEIDKIEKKNQLINENRDNKIEEFRDLIDELNSKLIKIDVNESIIQEKKELEKERAVLQDRIESKSLYSHIMTDNEELRDLNNKLDDLNNRERNIEQLIDSDLFEKSFELEISTKELNKREKFYNQFSKCQECGSEFPEDIRQSKILEIQKNKTVSQTELEKVNIEIDRQRKSFLKHINLERNVVNEKLHAFNKKLQEECEKIKNDLKIKIKELDKEITECELKEKELQEKKECLEKIEQYRFKIEQLQKVELLDCEEHKIQLDNTRILYDGKNKELSKLERLIIYLEKIIEIFADSGIRTVLIKKYLPLLNTKLNEFLNEFQCEFDVEFDENFDTVIKNRKEIVNYDLYSSGQRQRINLAILFTFMSFMKLKQGINCNLLFFDEVLDSSLDEEGIGIFFNILEKFSMKERYSIFVISHRESNESYFTNHLKVSMENKFSKIEKI